MASLMYPSTNAAKMECGDEEVWNSNHPVNF
jgi:hypothetical protein